MEDIRNLIDLKKHMLWSKRAEKALKEDLGKRYPGREEELWQKVQLQYAEFLKEQPYLGGRKNRQASGVYDSIMIFSYYVALPDKLSKKELEEVNNNVFLPVYEKIEGIMDANKPIFLKLMHTSFKMVEKQVKKHEKDWPGNYHMDVLPLDREHGIEYRFTSCPIADFARRVGLEDMMPCLCNADYPMLKQMGAGLIREYTCSNGNYCDYWITGSKSHHLEENPRYRDDEGYLRNKRKDSSK